MSRSHKKNPFLVMRLRYGKRLASRRARRHSGSIADGAAYKRIYPSWDVIDWVFYGPRFKNSLKNWSSTSDDDYQRFYVRK